MQFGTFYDRLEATEFLYIRTPAGNSNDTLSLQVSGSNLLVTMTLGSPVLRADPSSFTSVFPLSSVNYISIDMGGGSDSVTLTGNIPAELYIYGGEGNDSVTMHAANNVFNDGFSITTHEVYVDGGPGFNTLSVNDASRGSTQYDIYPDRIKAKDSLSSAWADFEYDNINALGIVASGSANTARVYGVSTDIAAGQQMQLLMGGGNDNVTIFPRDAQGNLTINGNLGVGGGSATDTMTVNDAASALPITYTFHNQFGSGTTNIGGLGSAGFGAGSDFESIVVNAGAGADTFEVNQYTSGTALTLNAGGGDDTLNIGNNNLPANITNISAFTFNGQADFDTFNLRNAAYATGFTWRRNIGTMSAIKDAYVLNISESGTERVFIDAGSGGDVFRITAVASGTQLDISAGAGIDALLLGDLTFSVSSIFGPITFDTGADAGRVSVVDVNSTVGKVAHLDLDSLGAYPGDTLFGAGGSLHFTTLVNQFAGFNFDAMGMSLGSGADTIFAQPFATGTVGIEGRNPTATPGDTLHLALATAENYVINGTPASGSVTSSNLMTLSFNGFETGPIIITSPELQGDYNRDLAVDAADYVLWRKMVGATVQAPYAGADGNGDTIINQEDHGVWAVSYGETGSGNGEGGVGSGEGAEELRVESVGTSTAEEIVQVETRESWETSGQGNVWGRSLTWLSRAETAQGELPSSREMPTEAANWGQRRDDGLLAWLVGADVGNGNRVEDEAVAAGGSTDASAEWVEESIDEFFAALAGA
jgi:hypothetical protein